MFSGAASREEVEDDDASAWVEDEADLVAEDAAGLLDDRAHAGRGGPPGVAAPGYPTSAGPAREGSARARRGQGTNRSRDRDERRPALQGATPGRAQAQKAARLKDAAQWIVRHEDVAIEHFADGSEIDPRRIDPVVVAVRTAAEADLFGSRLSTGRCRLCGYGRRTRFLVFDRQNDKLIAVFSLGDPVISQSARDRAIGWDTGHRNSRLYHVYDAFVLGAVEPYRQLLGGKLAALLTLSNEVRDLLTAKYSGTTTEISKEQKDPTPVLITTSSALGRSSVYNRVTYDGQLMLHSVGFTRGFGHFQFSDDLFGDLVTFVRGEVLPTPATKVGSSKYGSGPNWRFRVIRTALKALDIDESHLQHNVRREVFLRQSRMAGVSIFAASAMTSCPTICRPRRSASTTVSAGRSGGRSASRATDSGAARRRGSARNCRRGTALLRALQRPSRPDRHDAYHLAVGVAKQLFIARARATAGTASPTSVGFRDRTRTWRSPTSPGRLASARWSVRFPVWRQLSAVGGRERAVPEYGRRRLPYRTSSGAKAGCDTWRWTPPS